VALAAVLLVACGSSNDKKSSASASTTNAGSSKTQVNNHGTKDVSGKSSIKMNLADFFFAPTVLKGKSGQKVTLKLKNVGTVEHNFKLPAQHVSKDLAAGKSATVKVKIPKHGSLRYFCEYHRAKGMAGSLAVVGSSSGASPGGSGGTGGQTTTGGGSGGGTGGY
jgi:plastocyanin